MVAYGMGKVRRLYGYSTLAGAVKVRLRYGGVCVVSKAQVRLKYGKSTVKYGKSIILYGNIWRLLHCNNSSKEASAAGLLALLRNLMKL